MITDYIAGISSLAIIHLFAVMAPGPDFVMVSRNSLVYSRRTGILCAIGLGLGVMVHFIYCSLGLSLVITKSILLYSTIKFLGAGYLIYIGYQALTNKTEVSASGANLKAKQDLSHFEAVKAGFLTNLLNPKAAVYFLSIFTQFIKPETPMIIHGIYGAEIIFVTVAWFSCLALVLSHSSIKKAFQSIQGHIEKAMGGILVLLGLKIAFDRLK